MAAKREASWLQVYKPTYIEEMEDREFSITVSTLESSPSSPEAASLPAENISENFNGPKPVKMVLDDDWKDFLAEATVVFLDSREMDPIS